ncbi:MAG: TIM barrel protein, partial [Clostridia bacterium]|nr:TIM barrel protein [Clostridia bacterium]
RLNSIDYIMQSARAADMLGAGRIIVHSGSVSGMEREEAVALAAQTLKQAIAALDEAGLGHIAICPETMGKQNQLGTVGEVCDFCRLDERLIPCIDFGHLYARSLGAVEGYEASAAVLDEIKNALGTERMRNLHIHFSHIEFTAGGEKRHLNFRDGQFGPDFEPLCRALEDAGAEPVIISESAGMQDEDALEMMRIHTNR